MISSTTTLRGLVDGRVPSRVFGLFEKTHALPSAAHGERALRKPDGLESASLAGLRECKARLAELFYRMALAHFAEAERTSERVFILAPIPRAPQVRGEIEDTGAIARSLGRGTRNADDVVELAHLRRIAGSARARSRRWCEAALAASEGRHDEALELLGVQLLLEGDAPAALVAFDRLAASTSRPDRRARALANRGKALLDLGLPEAAARSCEEAARALPGHALAHVNLAIARLLCGDYPRALEAYERVDSICSHRSADPEKVARLVRSDLRWVAGLPSSRAEGARAFAREVQSMRFLSPMTPHRSMHAGTSA